MINKIFDNTHSELNKELIKRKKYLSNKVVAVFDIETTSLDCVSGEIIEIGVVKYYFDSKLNPVNGQGLSLLIKPSTKLSKKTIELTGLTDEYLERAGVDKGYAFKTFLTFMEDVDVVVHQNGNKFDMGYLSYHLLKYHIDTGIPFKLWAPHVSIDTLEVSKRQNPMEKKHNLKVLCERYGVPYDSESHHRAMYDAQITLGVFIQQLHHLGWGHTNNYANQSAISFLDTLIEECDVDIELPDHIHESQIKAYVSAFT